MFRIQKVKGGVRFPRLNEESTSCEAVASTLVLRLLDGFEKAPQKVQRQPLLESMACRSFRWGRWEGEADGV